MEILVVKTKDGYYISEDNKSYNSSLGRYMVNGGLPEKTFHKDWFFVPDEPKTLSKVVVNANINHRFVLKDKAFKSDKVQEVLERTDACYYEDYEWVWKDEYSHLSSLYELISDPVPDSQEEVAFTIKQTAELEKIVSPVGFDFKIQKTQWSHEGLRDVTQNDVQSQLIDKIVFPEIILPQKPSSFSSEMIYKIVRQHIKENINPKVAHITSDYDFCFTVKKIIPLNEPVKYTVDLNDSLFSKRKRKPKYETRYRKSRDVEIFEMTHAGKGYSGYTVIKAVVAKSHEDLKEKVDFYLESLMEFINKPVSDCPRCKGLGVNIADNAPSIK